MGTEHQRLAAPEMTPAPAAHPGPAHTPLTSPAPVLHTPALRGLARGPAAPSPAIRRVMMDGHDVKQGGPHSARHAGLLMDALNALAEAQNQDATNPDTWMWWVTDINTHLQTSGVSPMTLGMIEDFYTQVEELSFLSNPFLRQAWQNCLNATRSAAAKSKYSQVGSKFLRQSLHLLDEIKTDFSTYAELVKLCDIVAGFMKGYNKEHLVNKGGIHLGPQVEHNNLMGAGTPLVKGGSSISPLHQGLHAMKSGTGKLDYTALHPKIRAVIEKCQKKYSDQTMGSW